MSDPFIFAAGMSLGMLLSTLIHVLLPRIMVLFGHKKVDGQTYKTPLPNDDETNANSDSSWR